MNYAPLYIQIADQLRKDILDEKYPLGTLMPTEIQLEELFQVSKITIRNAMRILAEEGYVQKKSGLGTRVIRNTLPKKLNQIIAFSQILSEETQVEITNSTLEVVDVGDDDPLYELFGNKYLSFKRQYYHEKNLVASFVYKFKLNSLGYESIVDDDRVLALSDQTVSKVRDIFEIIYQDEALKALFGREVPALLKRTRTVLNDEGKIVGYHEGFVDTAVYPYVTEFEA